jgi:hypothetical protein
VFTLLIVGVTLTTGVSLACSNKRDSEACKEAIATFVALEISWVSFGTGIGLTQSVSERTWRESESYADAKRDADRACGDGWEDD